MIQIDTSSECGIAKTCDRTRNRNGFQCSTSLERTCADRSQSIVQTDISQGFTAGEYISSDGFDGFREYHRCQCSISFKCIICNTLNNISVDLCRNLHFCRTSGIAGDLAVCSIQYCVGKLRHICIGYRRFLNSDHSICSDCFLTDFVYLHSFCQCIVCMIISHRVCMAGENLIVTPVSVCICIYHVLNLILAAVIQSDDDSFDSVSVCVCNATMKCTGRINKRFC